MPPCPCVICQPMSITEVYICIAEIDSNALSVELETLRVSMHTSYEPCHFHSIPLARLQYYYFSSMIRVFLYFLPSMLSDD